MRRIWSIGWIWECYFQIVLSPNHLGKWSTVGHCPTDSRTADERPRPISSSRLVLLFVLLLELGVFPPISTYPLDIEGFCCNYHFEKNHFESIQEALGISESERGWVWMALKGHVWKMVAVVYNVFVKNKKSRRFRRREITKRLIGLKIESNRTFIMNFEVDKSFSARFKVDVLLNSPQLGSL